MPVFSPIGDRPFHLRFLGVCMCVRVTLVPPDARPAFDADERVITIPRSLTPEHRVTLVRAILHELAVPQPEFGAVCWCGTSVDIPRIPHQRRSEQVVKHGA
ncbi:hypothetical protein [Streptomyces longwoodensis]|uniref:hypothetical protein n=1 Tax=Streptomyces longwoodensis TaxID=68231 RepID=UPI00224E79AA|nr:hypothetical protein [Streptomyces longwoodensis]MCX4994306.1 hypothetical protein [Streptomyces longwoodensis]